MDLRPRGIYSSTRMSITDKSPIENDRALSEFRSCMKVEMAVLGFPSLIVMVSVDVKQHLKKKKKKDDRTPPEQQKC